MDQDFANFLIGKTISGVRLPEGTDGADGFDLIFSDGSELEVYTVPKITWAMLTPAEAREAAESEYPDWPLHSTSKSLSS